MTKFYSVHKGRTPGIYSSWDCAEAQIKGFKGAKFKSFNNINDAKYFEKYGKNTNKTTEIINPVKINPSNIIQVWTDGSALNNGKYNAKGGVGVYFGPDDIRNISEKLISNKPTNNLAELTAILNALVILIREKRHNDNIYLYSDSKYSIDAITKWAINWEKNGWINSTKKKVINKETIYNIRQLYTQFTQFNFIHVNSHQPEPFNKDSKEWTIWYGNDQVDKLAVIGANSN